MVDRAASSSGSDGAAARTLIELVRQNAQREGTTLAYRFVHCDGAAQLSYAEVEFHARCVAVQLQQAALDQAPAVLLLPTGSTFVAAFFGCAFAGIAAVPVALPSNAAQRDTLLSIIRRSGARAVLSERGVRDRLLRRHDFGDALQSLPWLLLDDADSDPAAWCEPPLQPDSPAVLQFTSGSTGQPRGVVVTHANVLANQRLIEQGFRHADDAVVVGWLPLFHDMGLIGNMLNPFALRRPCILMPPQAFLRTPRLWLETIAHYRATTSGGPNFAFELCVNRIGDALDDLDLSSWRVAFVGAEPVRAATLRRFARKFSAAGFAASAFYPCYGLAEATLIVSGTDRGIVPAVPACTDVAQGEGEMPPAAATVRCGAALGGQQLLVVEPRERIPCADGVAGEVWVAGDCVAAGYHADAEATRATFAAFLNDGRGPFLRTGDIGVIDAGELRLCGRLKNMIIVNGVNLYAEDVEGWLDQCHPALVAGGVAAFASLRDGSESLTVAAEIRRDASRTLDAAAVADRLRQHAAERIAVPLGEIVLCKTGALPRTSSGKVQHWQCAEQLGADNDKVLHRSRIESASRFAASASGALVRTVPAITAWLRRGIARLTAQPESAIASSASFVHLGISSADALQLTVELGKALDLELDDTLLWEYPSIDAVAAQLARPAE